MATRTKKAVKKTTEDIKALPTAWVDSLNISAPCVPHGVLEVHVKSVNHVSGYAEVYLPDGKSVEVKTVDLYEKDTLTGPVYLCPTRLLDGYMLTPKWLSFNALIEGRVREAAVRRSFDDFLTHETHIQWSLIDAESQFNAEAAHTELFDTRVWYRDSTTAHKLLEETYIHDDGTEEKRGGTYRKYALTREQQAAFHAVEAAIEAAKELGVFFAYDLANESLRAVNNTAHDVRILGPYEDSIDVIPHQTWAGGSVALLTYLNEEDSFAVRHDEE